MIESFLLGTIKGRIWMPAVTCTKTVSINLTRERHRYSDGPTGTFRHFIAMSVVNDGDFQSSLLTRDSVVVARSTKYRNGTLIRRERAIPITKFRSIRDCVAKR